MGSSRKRRKPAKLILEEGSFHLFTTERKHELILQEAIKGYSMPVIAEKLGCSSNTVWHALQSDHAKDTLKIEKEIREAMFQDALDKHTEQSSKNWMKLHEMVDGLLMKRVEKLAKDEFEVTEETIEQEPISILNKREIANRLLEEGLYASEETMLEMQRKILPISKVSRTRKKPSAKDILTFWNTVSKHFFSYSKRPLIEDETTDS